MENGQTIETPQPGSRVDVPPVRTATDRLSGIVSVNKRGQPLDGLGLVPKDRLGRSIEAKQCDIERRRIARLEHRRRLRPIPVRHIGMHDPDRSVRRRNANRNGHGGKRIAPPLVIDRWESLQPLGIGRRSSPPTRLEPAQDGAIMIAERDRREPGLKPYQRISRVGTAVDEITDAEESIAHRVEAQSIESTLEGAEAPVDVTDHEVPTVDIGRKDPVSDRRRIRSGKGDGFEVRVRASGGRKAAPVLHHTGTGIVEVCTPIIPRHPGANRMGETYLGNVEIDAGLRSPNGERGPEAGRISDDLQLREQFRKCIVVEHPAPHGEEDEIGVRASASNARQVGVIARLAQDRESRRRKRDGVCFALLHSQGRHAPCGLREIDLRPSRPAGLVRAHGREDEKLEKQSRANPGIRRAH